MLDCYAHGLEDTGSTLGVPAFDATVELVASFEDVIEPFLVPYRVCEAVPEHAFCEMW